MDKKDLAHFKELLLAERNSILHQFQVNNSFGLDENLNDSIGELTSYDNHPADIGTEVFERGKDIALQENERHILDLVDEALQRFENGTYGYCVTCHQEIPKERLEAIPYAKYCIKHQTNNEISIQRPIEEQFLRPPFGRTSFDGKVNETEFDGEDAWQTVARYGTSNSADYFANAMDYNHTWIESDEPDGYVDQIEGFLVTDITGSPSVDHIDVVRNEVYEAYIKSHEGEEGIAEIHIDDKNENEK
ncbi:TraR/DksA C4-type zinc finger protein [Tepidibacillus fermentans]|uniref:TraR/DksA family transcriptional regulator n=1 Tax=Tepidibacillus fermentans TaxID=1281767 RepID=A0A4R3KLB3_9BACI|nr:TraR/DksA C4-type zinc finger protein [Tepidibacillus fermentans]TCS84392.1 TraR/DksA family transcriptional regulator [Tepidibacillus fermentans]